MIKKTSQSSRSPKVPKKPRLVYIETDDMRRGAKRRTVMRGQPKRGYFDDTTITSRSGTVVSSRDGKIAKIKVVDRPKRKSSASKPVMLGGVKKSASRGKKK